MAVCLMGPCRHLGGITIFYSSSILWDSELSSIWVKWILLNLTLGSRDHFHPESTLLPTIVCCTKRFWRYSMMFSRDFGPSLLEFPSIDKHLWITMHTCHSYIHSPLILLLQDTPVFSLLFWEYFVPTALSFLATWIPQWIISRAYRVSAHP